jgi:hyperosmotically inducible protein
MNTVSKMTITFALAAVGALADDRVPTVQSSDEQRQSEQSVARMAEMVERQILRTPEYGLFDDIRFTLDDSIVTLKGYASRPILRNSVEASVRKVEGVEDVVNEIEQLPLSAFDEDIRFRAYVAIYGHPWLNRYNPNRGAPVFFSQAAIAQGISLDPPTGFHPIHIIVRNGHLRLIGVVDNAGDKVLAGMVDRNLPGTFQVENELAIADEAKPLRNEKTKAFGL